MQNTVQFRCQRVTNDNEIKRLSDLTHRLAKISLDGVHGQSMVHADW